jgi:hypothetical protein
MPRSGRQTSRFGLVFFIKHCFIKSNCHKLRKITTDREIGTLSLKLLLVKLRCYRSARRKKIIPKSAHRGGSKVDRRTQRPLREIDPAKSRCATWSDCYRVRWQNRWLHCRKVLDGFLGRSPFRQGLFGDSVELRFLTANR